MIYLILFWEFFKTGLFSIGGGLATIPFLMDMADRYGWFTRADLSNMIAVSESTPGPIGINMATYVGFTTCGVPGSLIATTGLVLPSLVIILIIAGFLTKFKENKLVKDTFYVLRPTVVGLLCVSVLSIVNTVLFNFSAGTFLGMFNLWAIAVFAVLLFLIIKFKKHPIVYIAIGAVAGIIFKF